MRPADALVVEFKRHLQAVAVPAEAVYLMSRQRITTLSGSSIQKLAPLLDGTRTVAEVKREVSPYLSAAETDQLIARLSEVNLINLRRPAAGARDGGAEGYWDFAGLDADCAAAALAAAEIEILALGSAGWEEAAAACRGSGLRVTEPGSGAAALALVLCDDYLDPELASVNASRLASRRPWLLAKPTGPDLWIGPVFTPGAGACWECLAKRVAGNRHGEFLMRRVRGDRRFVPPREVSLSAGRTAGLQLAALELTKWLAGYRYAWQQDLYVLNSLDLSGAHHLVPRRPQCPACGDPGLVTGTVLRPLAVSRRADGDDNGQRALGLEAVLQQFGHLVDPVTGIIDEIRPDPDSPEFICSYLSGRNRAMAASRVEAIKVGLRSHSGGKGVTEMEARVGALCEAVERYCGTRDGDEPTVRDSYAGLGDRAVHPDACQLFGERQFADRARWNAACAPFHRVPEPFGDQALIDWTPVWSLLTGEQKLLPTSLLYYDLHAGHAVPSVQANSNGNAAGGSLEDAILHGFFELVERDAVAIWWYNRTRQPGVCLDSCDDPWAARLPELYARLDREVSVLDVTSDLGIPVMAAVSRRTDKPAEDIMMGFGAHFDPRVALRRALTELGQLLPSVVNAGADGTGYGTCNPHLLHWWTKATVRDQPYLLPQRTEAVRTTGECRDAHRQGIAGICAIARQAGLDILVLDQTRPDIKMPVVKVVVPGLRHFWPRFAPGRLFEVPVRLGRLAEPTAYECLNPLPLYI